MLKMDGISPEFQDWLKNDFGDFVRGSEGNAFVQSKDSFMDNILDRADSVRYAPIDAPEELYGIDMAFAAYFITDDMKEVFPGIAAAFLREEPMLFDLTKAEDGLEIFYPFRKEKSLQDAYNFRILALMLICARKGSRYSRELILTLYKTFYKKEYNILKRMKELSMRTFVSTFTYRSFRKEDEENSWRAAADLARIYVISDLLGIKLDRMWNRGLEIQNDEFFQDNLLWKTIFASISDKIIQEKREVRRKTGSEWLITTFPDIAWAGFDDFDSDDSRFEILDTARHLIENVFDMYGMSSDIIYGERSFDLLENASAVLESPKNLMGEEDLENIILLAVIYYLADMLGRTLFVHNSELNDLLGVRIRDIIPDDDFLSSESLDLSEQDILQLNSMMKLDRVRSAEEEKKTEAILKKTGAVKSVRTGGGQDRNAGKANLSESKRTGTEKDSGKRHISGKKPETRDEKDRQIELLQEQLEEKKRLLKKANEQISWQRSLYEESRKKAELFERKAEAGKAEHAELVSLRNFVHEMKTEDISETPCSDAEMTACLRKYRILIVGGHENWIKKMKLIYPEWFFVGARDGISLEGTIKSCDAVYFYTDIVGHSMYYRFMNLALELGTPFRFLHGTNIGVVTRKIYRDMCVDG